MDQQNRNALVESHFAWLRKLAKREKRHNTVELRDLEQEGALALCSIVERYNSSRQTLTAFAKPRVVGSMKTLGRRSTGKAQEQAGELADGDPLPDAAAFTRQCWSRMDSLLSPRERNVIDGIYLEGRTQLEIAKRFGVTQPYISAIHRGALALMRGQKGIFN